MDIDAKLAIKVKRLKEVIESLRDDQIIESCDRAKASSVEKLRLCVDLLDEAVSNIEAVQDER